MWAAAFLQKLDRAGVKVWAFIKYVDDINIVLSMIKEDVRWDGDQLLIKEGGSELGVVPSEGHTMDLILQAADSILPWLSFTKDLPSMHKEKMVPMLDMQVWIKHAPPGSNHPDSLAWMFYKKKVSTSRVLKATSAYNWRSKTVTMTMEVMRRMRNTTRQATMKMRLDIMKTFVRKLQRRGYSSSTVTGMVESGLRFYYRKVRIELEGGPPVNSRDDTNDVGKKRAKLGASLRWFNRRRGGQEEKSLKENGWRQESSNSSGRKVQISREGPRRTVDKVDVSQEEGA